MINIIVAVSKNNQIGMDNKLPWHIPEDLRYFKEKTKGHMVIMGRKTYESIGKPLPNRKNVVLTRDPHFYAEGVTTVHSLEEALALCKSEDECYIAGGGEIYRAFLPFSDKLYITVVDKLIDGDTSFPEYTDSFELISSTPGTTLTADNHSFAFTIWKKLYA